MQRMGEGGRSLGGFAAKAKGKRQKAPPTADLALRAFFCVREGLRQMGDSPSARMSYRSTARLQPRSEAEPSEARLGCKGKQGGDRTGAETEKPPFAASWGILQRCPPQAPPEGGGGRRPGAKPLSFGLRRRPLFLVFIIKG